MSTASKLALPAPWLSQWAALRTRWRGVAARERRLPAHIGLPGMPTADDAAVLDPPSEVELPGSMWVT